jgi:hypothetical protein
MKVPEEIAAVCEAGIDTALIEAHWDSLVHLAASVSEWACQRGDGAGPVRRAARGDPIYDAGVQLGKLLRTAFLADYFVNAGFRRELRRVLNRGEAVNALKRAIYTGRVGPHRPAGRRDAGGGRRAEPAGQHRDGLEHPPDAAVLDRWANRRQLVPPELIGRVAPTRLEGINLRGVFRFPLERYAQQILPSQATAKTSAVG